MLSIIINENYLLLIFSSWDFLIRPFPKAEGNHDTFVFAYPLRSRFKVVNYLSSNIIGLLNLNRRVINTVTVNSHISKLSMTALSRIFSITKL